jgi:hypothetical protein
MIFGLLCFLVISGIIGGIGYKYYLDQQSGIDASQLIRLLSVRGRFDLLVCVQGEIDCFSKSVIVCIF